MELKEATKNILAWANINDISELPTMLMKIVLDNNSESLDKYSSIVGGLKIDWLQKCYQFYLSDRGKGTKQQDYTPFVIQRLISAISVLDKGPDYRGIVYDCCAGSGALTIATHGRNGHLKFVCEELDENVIPFLLFNLMIRNIDAVVLHGDVLANKIFEAWQLTPAEKYSVVAPLENYELGKYDLCISNPPYNIRWNPPDTDSLFEKDERFSFGMPPAGNANYAFVEHCLYHVKEDGDVAMILPNGVLQSNSKQEKEIIKNLVEQKTINAIISLPGNMFESTSIATCIIKYHRESPNCMMIDARQSAIEEIREQRGEGDKSHTERIYKKKFNTFDTKTINKIYQATLNRKDEVDFAGCVAFDAIKEEDYNLIPRRYIPLQEQEFKHREYVDIINDLNRVARERAAVKLTINKTVAERLGIHKVVENDQLFTESEEIIDRINNSGILQLLNLPPLEKAGRWLTISKNKGECKIENMDKDGLSSILVFLMPQFIAMFHQHIYYLNNIESRLMMELRDALLPELMSGKIDVSQIK